MHKHQPFIDAATFELAQRGFTVGDYAQPIDETIVLPFSRGPTTGFVTASAREIRMNENDIAKLAKARCDACIRQAEAN